MNTYPQGVSPTGVWDGSGNVWEWMGNPYEPDGNTMAIRGGSWDISQWNARVSIRYFTLPVYFSYSF